MSDYGIFFDEYIDGCLKLQKIDNDTPEWDQLADLLDNIVSKALDDFIDRVPNSNMSDFNAAVEEEFVKRGGPKSQGKH